MTSHVSARRRTARAGILAALAIGVALVAAGGSWGGDSSPQAAGSASPVVSEAARAGGGRSADSPNLLGRLRAGGAVIVFRHAATDRSMPDDERVDLNDCSTQRNLTDEGRADARAIGRAFRHQRIPVGTVWASPYCRARETAELAFGRATVISGLEQLYPVTNEAAQRRLNRLIRERAPSRGKPNMVIASHAVYPSVLAPAAALDEGDAAVYVRRGSGFALIGEVSPRGWAKLRSAPSGSTAARGAGAAAAAREALSSVVAVEVKGRGVTGSGFRVAVDLIVVTSAAAVGNAKNVSVVLRDGSRRTARVLGCRPALDIAALELADDSGLPPMHSGTGLAELRVGDPVRALASRSRQSSGTVRSLARLVQLRGGGSVIVLRTDIPTAISYRGGPVIDAQGSVVGVSTAIATPTEGGGGYAIPVDVAKRAALAIVNR